MENIAIIWFELFVNALYTAMGKVGFSREDLTVRVDSKFEETGSTVFLVFESQDREVANRAVAFYRKWVARFAPNRNYTPLTDGETVTTYTFDGVKGVFDDDSELGIDLAERLTPTFAVRLTAGIAAD